MLQVNDINVFYGAIQALNNVSLSVQQGEIVAIIGSNGAGKSTLMRTLSGLLRTRSGSISFLGEDITDLVPDQIVRRGISQSPEGRKIFTNMTVHENILIGATIRNDQAAIKDDMEQILARFPRLRERLKQNAGTLSGGEQQMLAIGRALMSQPKLLLLDEPSMGLAPNLVAEIFDIITDVKAEGVTVLVVEQNAHKALSIADRAYVLETGSLVLEGTGKELLNSDKVREAYLGG
ncbi:MAG: ABC transporter ATP-binding protein [Fimbriimonadaceae bacterium]|nr:ABC transporter ATP-binding protein [Fimbriimonadaceae bacterium]